MMNINNEQEAHAAVAGWLNDPIKAQLRNLQLAIEKMELAQMYYEQKGNVQGVERLRNCLNILAARKAEIDQELL